MQTAPGVWDKVYHFPLYGRNGHAPCFHAAGDQPAGGGAVALRASPGHAGGSPGSAFPTWPLFVATAVPAETGQPEVN